MKCPKCQSENVETAPLEGMVRCADCDHTFPNFNSPQVQRELSHRVDHSGRAETDTKADESSAIIFGLLVVLILVAIGLGFISIWLGVAVAIIGLLAGILFFLARIAGRK